MRDRLPTGWKSLDRVTGRVVSRPLGRVGRVDRAISRRIADRPPSVLDPAMKALSAAADHGVLWFTVAALLAARRGVTRKAAARGVLAIGGASQIGRAHV